LNKTLKPHANFWTGSTDPSRFQLKFNKNGELQANVVLASIKLGKLVSQHYPLLSV
jgi:hypothetical protein